MGGKILSGIMVLGVVDVKGKRMYSLMPKTTKGYEAKRVFDKVPK